MKSANYVLAVKLIVIKCGATFLRKFDEYNIDLLQYM